MIDTPQIKKAIDTLQKYKNGKSNLENKIKENEQFWKLRHWEQQRDEDYIPATAWLWNVITAKHADMEEAFPEPNILPRAQDDEMSADMLKKIIPVILEQNEFKRTWSDCNWYKLKQGCSIYGVFWDKTKHGIGDIVCKKIDALNLFWEPGITDIQESRNIFYTELIDNDILEAMYPQLQGKLSASTNMFTARYIYDDTVDTSEKSTVIDWYYHSINSQGKRILHYCKFCGDEILYATENETEPIMGPITDPNTGTEMFDPVTGQPLQQEIAPSKAESGLYDHGLYPFVFDSESDIEGTPFGYGDTDINKDTQISIDQINCAAVINTLLGSKTRFLRRMDTNVNMEQFADWKQDFIDVAGNLDDESLREITINPLSSIYMDILNSQIDMLKETSGNRDVNNGGAPSGVTAASAIAALQEEGNKHIRDVISGSYEAYKKIVLLVIELIRQFYDVPRQFRIAGEQEGYEFVTFDNSAIKPQPQGVDFGRYMGERLPLFDIEVTAQKATTYNKISNNELMLQFSNLGFFQPENAVPALACLKGMDFNKKSEVEDIINENATFHQGAEAAVQMLYSMAQMFDPSVLPSVDQVARPLGVGIQPQAPVPSAAAPTIPETDTTGGLVGEEHPFVRNARANAQNVTPD